MILSLVVALDHTYAIGRAGGLPWTPDDVPGEQKLFRKLTQGRPVIMGRKTWDSLPDGMRPLQARPNYILTRDPGWRPDPPPGGVPPVRVSLDFARLLDDLRAERWPEAFVIGGAQVYAEAYPLAGRVYLTLVAGRHEADTYFPRAVISDPRWHWEPDPVNGKGYTRHILTRRTAGRQPEAE